MAEFVDHFSRTAASYATYRPRYPDALFAWLASIAPRRERVWDCGTGSGQAATALAKHFREVIATDPGVALLQHASPSPKVSYAAMTAERSALATGSTQLVTVAQALHWFTHDEFYAEARRVLCDGGVVAVWSYGLLSIDPALDALILPFYGSEVGPYWPAERALVDEGYANISFPFRELNAPAFAMEAAWTLAQFSGYLDTWSAVTRYKAANGVDPVPAFIESIRSCWEAGGATRIIRWPLEVRAGTA